MSAVVATMVVPRTRDSCHFSCFHRVPPDWPSLMTNQSSFIITHVSKVPATVKKPLARWQSRVSCLSLSAFIRCASFSVHKVGGRLASDAQTTTRCYSTRHRCTSPCRQLRCGGETRCAVHARKTHLHPDARRLGSGRRCSCAQSTSSQSWTARRPPQETDSETHTASPGTCYSWTAAPPSGGGLK